jgi:class 3 adenylate cyclase
MLPVMRNYAPVFAGATKPKLERKRAVRGRRHGCGDFRDGGGPPRDVSWRRHRPERLAGHVQRGHRHQVHAVIFYSDMRNSATLAASASLETYLSTLNTYFDCIVDAVDAQSGEVLKFTGDGVLAMFPFEEGTQAGTKACGLAVAAARDALGQLGNVNAQRAAAGASEIRCGIALHAGEVMYGNVDGAAA